MCLFVFFFKLAPISTYVHINVLSCILNISVKLSHLKLGQVIIEVEIDGWEKFVLVHA